MGSLRMISSICIAVFALSALNQQLEAAKSKKSVDEPKVQAGEPAPKEGDCPCSKIACVGEKGPKGAPGDAGPPGPLGPKGDHGTTGPKGPSGNKGDQGLMGPRGPPGTVGKTGPSGKPGVDGNKGEKGEQGLQGLNGARGAQGVLGHKGEDGPSGVDGKPGAQGVKGETGDKGGTGSTGSKGSKGEQGPQGPHGKPGPNGTPGKIGPTGPKGPQGDVGPMGPKGREGRIGAMGARGLQGHTGAKGAKGDFGPIGATGSQGPRGPQGAQGVQGHRGPSGSCASQCSEIKKQLEARIDALKKYTDGKVSHLQRQIDELNKRPPPDAAPLGSEHNPAKSCSEITKQKRQKYNSGRPSGAYWLKTETPAGKSLVYCHLGNIAGCGKGGWTLAMKINGNAQTFTYSSPLWSNTKELNPGNGRTSFDHAETKLATYWSTPFRYVCLGMKVGNTLKFVRISYNGKSLYSVIADGKYRATKIGRNAWKTLLPTASLQRNCNREGFNVHFPGHGSTKVRIGIVSNQEADCHSTDSRIGFGASGTHCGQNNANSCGNEARCSSDKGDRSVRAYGYIFVL